jgi:predicted ArsR family transcriptional regulator
MSNEDEGLPALAALNEPMRRRLYTYVAGQESAVSREQAATTLGMARSVAAFHLDKLAEVGLLEVEYRRPPGRGGPGAGRPAKMYRRAAGEVAVSVPERHYDLAALLLARAVEEASDGSVTAIGALRSIADEYGRTLGAQVDWGEDRSSVIQQLSNLLAEHGYEPRLAGTTMTLVNCPFHALADEHRELVCGMNYQLIRGVVQAAGLPGTSARLDPAPGRCCVTLMAPATAEGS